MQYDHHPPLTEADLHSDPLVQFERWLVDAEKAGQIEPTAMTLATADRDHMPSARMVLFKGLHGQRLTFYTHYESRKAEDLAAHPQAALLFWWDRLERQLRIEGRVEKLPRAMSAEYFHRRAQASQVAAYTSRQSRVAVSRENLDQRMAENLRAFEGKEVPLPDSWGGYALIPERFEFWQGRRARLHDRLQYFRAGSGWKIQRLEP